MVYNKYISCRTYRETAVGQIWPKVEEDIIEIIGLSSTTVT